jgi:sRNA-binding regulator protein Hfq
MDESSDTDTTDQTTRGVSDPSKVPAVVPAGPRKLVRPTLPPSSSETRRFSRRGPASSVLSHAAESVGFGEEASHAEAFYLQKQSQSQTLMVFVLEDGEQIEGYIEWYDRNVIKVRHGSRTLIYKSSIKYLYKAGENSRA